VKLKTHQLLVLVVFLPHLADGFDLLLQIVVLLPHPLVVFLGLVAILLVPRQNSILDL